MAKRPAIVKSKREAFLVALAEIGNIAKACKAARVSRSMVYLWRSSDADFASAWDKAREIAGHAIEDSLYERGQRGLLEPIYQQGRKVGTKRVFDTTAAIFLLKGIFPDKYRERGTFDLNLIPNMPARLDAAEKRLKALKGES